MNTERSLGFLFFLILLLFPHQEEKVVYGSRGAEQVHPNRLCQTKSHKFHGICTSHTNCANICRTEGFPNGHCRGLRRRCFCEKNC